MYRKESKNAEKVENVCFSMIQSTLLLLLLHMNNS